MLQVGIVWTFSIKLLHMVVSFFCVRIINPAITTGRIQEVSSFKAHKGAHTQEPVLKSRVFVNLRKVGSVVMEKQGRDNSLSPLRIGQCMLS
jgi:hypothetical protein